MYIKDIDNIIDNTLNNVFSKWVINDKKSDNLIDIKKLIAEQNLVKHQKDINNTMDLLFTLISQDEIKKMVNKDANIFLLNNIIKKYVAYFIFLFIGVFSKSKIETFNNNLVEFSRNQTNYSIKITDFFNSDSNSKIIKLISFIRDIFDFFNKLIVIEKKKTNININISRISAKLTKKEMVEVKEKEGKEGKEEEAFNDNVNELLLNYNDEFIKFIKSFSIPALLNIKSLYSNTYVDTKDILQQHIFVFKLIKILIFKGPYLYNTERTDIFNKVDSSETSNGEYIYIDIVVPQTNFIDYNTIETILDPEELNTDIPEIINNLLNDDFSNDLDERRRYFIDTDHKIQKLFDTGIIIPIVDDFLLYNRDNEKYVRSDSSKILNKDEEYKKNKEDTKIKFIINKISSTSDYYKNEKEIKSLFYAPLQNRNAILVNSIEDIKIINKLSNLTKSNNENLDLLTDLKNYNSYPYISFRDFVKVGFRFFGDKTTVSYRNINFNKKNSQILETRIINDVSNINIVGFAIVNTKDTPECLSINDFIDINTTTNIEDGNLLNIVTSLINDKLRSKMDKTYKSMIEKNYYLLFDSKNMDINIPNYNTGATMSKNDVAKTFMAYLYDNMLDSIINIFKKDILKDNNYLYNNFKKLDHIKNKYPDISNKLYADSVNDIDNIIYHDKIVKDEDIYDYNEDIFLGLYGNVHKLPTAPIKLKPLIPRILINDIDFKVDEKNKEKEDETIDLNENINDNINEYVKAVCQHIISLDKITEIKKYNETLYSRLIYEYTQQYVEMDPNQNYICKSCKSDINIKRYIIDGAFDNKTQQFIPLTISITSYIEDLPEYDKYKIAIKSIDKIIDRIGLIINFPGISGIIYSSKSKRRLLIKDVIELVLNNNKNLEQYMPIRDKLLKDYGLSKEKSKLFKFTLDNDIFIYSSKDKDKSIFKITKYNNVISYISIIIILELTDSQILNFKNDKICSYLIYKKIGYTLFDGINIIVNKDYDLTPIREYPILCYIIYIISCSFCKYNIWGDLNRTEEDSKKFDLNMQKSIIHTMIELLNTIIKNDIETSKKNKIYIYDILINKYFRKLELFKSKDLINRLDILYASTTLSTKDSIVISTTTKYDIEPNNVIDNKYVFDNLYYANKKYEYQRYIMPKPTEKLITINSINNLTNCANGQFHKFKLNGLTLKCSNCDIVADLKALDNKKTPEIYKNAIMIYLQKLSKKYCKNGKIHIFNYGDKYEIKCQKCSYIKDTDNNLNEKALLDMYKHIAKNILDSNIYIDKIINKVKDKNSVQIKNIRKVYEKVVYKFKKNDNNIDTILTTFLDNIQKLLGLDILIDKNVHNLYDNIYIIDHDINGSALEKPVQVYDNDKKFRIVYNQPHYKRDVLIHTVQKNTKYEVFYDLYKRYLIGYREINKEYVNIEKINCKIKVVYSIKNIFLMYGFTRQYINIKDMYPDLYGFNIDKIKEFISKDDFKVNFVNNIFHRRFSLIKKLCNNININVHRLYKKFKVNLLETTDIHDAELINNPIDVIYNNYLKKIDNPIDISDKDKNHTFLKYNGDINTYVPYEKFKFNKKDDVIINDNINFDLLYKYDFNSNLILNYLITEIIRLLDYNTNKVIKTNIISLILEITISLFNTYNMDIYNFDKEVDHFNQVLYTSAFYIETQNIDNDIDIIDYYDSYKIDTDADVVSDESKAKIIDEKEDDEEEQNALDIDEELDNEGMFDSYYENAPSRNVGLYD